MKIEQIQKSIKQGKIYWRKHALQRMFERKISREDVFDCVSNGTITKIYTNTAPYPAALIEGLDTAGKKLHVIIGFDEDRDKSYVITVYRPKGRTK